MRFRAKLGSAGFDVGDDTRLPSDLAVLRNGFSIPHERRRTVWECHAAVSEHGRKQLYAISPPSRLTASKRAADLPTPSAPGPNSRHRPTVIYQSIAAISSRHRIDPDLISSVIRAESNFNAHAVSPQGRTGVHATDAENGVQLGVANRLIHRRMWMAAQSIFVN